MKAVITWTWLIATAADFWVTMLWVRMQMAETNVPGLTAAGVLTANEAATAPWIVAVVEASIRIPLVYALANYGESIVRQGMKESEHKPEPVEKPYKPQSFSPPPKRGNVASFNRITSKPDKS